MRRSVLIGSLLIGVVLSSAPPAGAQSLLAAVLPLARSVQVNNTATAFATIINTGSSTATGCRIEAGDLQPVFTFQTTDKQTNQLTGTVNTPVSIPAGDFQTFVVAITPTTAFFEELVEILAPGVPVTTLNIEAQLDFVCTNAMPAPTVPGLNTLTFAISTMASPDIVALSATTTGDGAVTIPGTLGTGAFAVATINLGVTGTVVVTADTGTTSGDALPVTLTLCRTDPLTGACISIITSSLTVQIAAGAAPTFAIFVTGLGTPIPFDPAAARVFVRFRDAAGPVTRGATSVAIRMTN